mgnify:CR=1 FL=1
MTDQDAEMDAIVAELEAAGPVTVEVRPDEGEGYVLTPQGEQSARQMAMSSEDDAATLLDADLG